MASTITMPPPTEGSVYQLWESLNDLPDPCEPTLFKHSEGFGLPARDSHSLAALAAFKFAGIGFEVVDCNNPSVSPNGSLPFLKLYNSHLVAGLENVLEYIDKRADRSNQIDVSQDTNGAMNAYIAMINAKCHKALLHELWCEKQTRVLVSRPVYLSSMYPWPLDFVLGITRLYEIWNYTLPLATYWRSPDMIYKEAEYAYNALASRLSDNDFFSGRDKPTSLDAVAYGHLAFVLHCHMPSNKLAPLVQRHQNLVNFCARIKRSYFDK